MEKVALFTRMGMSMRVNGLTTKLRGTESTRIWTARSTPVSGKLTSKMGRARKPGLMAPCMRATTLWERSMDKVHLYGQTAHSIRDNFRTTTLKARGSTNGQMAENSREIGVTTRWMAEASLHGLTIANTRVNISKIRNRAWVPSTGLMAGNTLDNGTMENNMAEERSQLKTASHAKENGIWANVSNGLMSINNSEEFLVD